MMDYDAILAQVLVLLQQEKRLAYRVLKRRFQLDDELLEDLKDDLIYAKKLAVDEDGRVLVWAGDASAPSAPTPTPPEQARPQSQPAYAPEGAASSVAPHEPAAERRQLTVLFCDLVGSTPLSEQLDPEDLRDVVRAYQQTCAEVIKRFDGHIAQYLGDGLLVYFGYPQAHEDDAQRAVRAGLDILTAMGMLNTCLEREKGVGLAIRMGMHTGPVVVGEMGGGGQREQLALGETPNIAARLQSLAAPNSMLIGERTRRLVGGAFDVEELGLHALKGVSAPMQVYGIRGESAAESRFEAASARGLTPLIGREEELGLLRQRWHQAQAGEGQVFLLAGEAGIGKSRLIQTCHEWVAAEPHIRMRYQCSPYYSTSAFYPIITQLERAARLVRDEPPAQKLAKLENLLAQATERVADVAPLIAALLSIPTGDRYPPLDLTPQRQKEKTIEALVDQLIGLARRQPVLLLFEDTHWSDPTSLDVLDRMVHRGQEARVLAVITYRPEFEAPWKAMSHVTALTLTRLSRQQGAAMVERITAGKALPQEVLTQILAKTDGVPLFLEELTKTILESGLLREVGDHYAVTGPLPPLAIPSTLQDSLTARLDRLAPVKEVAQIGAAIGREFAYELLAAVAPVRDHELADALHQLVAAGLLFRHGQPPEARYLFKHALVRDAAYASLLRSTRQQLHTRIATVLEERFPDTTAAQPELVAHHFTEAGLHAQAVSYWHKAGQRATQRSAHVEAIAHLTEGLEALKTLPETPERTEHELALQLALGAPLQATKGYAAPERQHAYARAWELCQQVGETPQRFSVLFGLWQCYALGAEWQTARAVGEQLLSLAQRQRDPGALLEAHRALAFTVLWLGALAAAQTHAEQGMALYDPQQHHAHAFLYGQDPGMTCRADAALALWGLGYPDQALARSHEALTIAQERSHPYSVAMALGYAALIRQFRREVHATHERAEATRTLYTEQGFPFFLALGTILRGWALAEQGAGEEGVGQICQGWAAWRATGTEACQSYFLVLLAEARGTMGQAEAGLRVLTETRTLVDKTGERFWETELDRLEGQLLLQRAVPDTRHAETCFHQALNMARRQQAKSLELRAAMSLARLWQQQGKRVAARELLAPVYGWFTEGFDTADLQEAKALLEELSSS
jgi:predicted ATPase/class 3 adenylate cyclase